VIASEFKQRLVSEKLEYWGYQAAKEFRQYFLLFWFVYIESWQTDGRTADRRTHRPTVA